MTNYLEEYFGMNEEQRKIEKELKTIQLAREFLLRALSTAYQQDPKSKTIKKGLRELAYVFLYGKWPVSLKTTISIDGIDIQAMALRIADTLEGVQESMRSDILAVHLQIKDPKGGPDWFIGNLVGGNHIIDPRFGIFAYQIGQKGHSASLIAKNIVAFMK